MDGRKVKGAIRLLMNAWGVRFEYVKVLHDDLFMYV